MLRRIAVLFDIFKDCVIRDLYYLTEEADRRRCSVKKVFLNISQNSQENSCARVSFLIKFQVQTCNFIKNETLTQLFFYEFCEILKNSFFMEYLRYLRL